jgi:folate-dependent phosphoribosylglycinamide formyltransferase PurN/acyl carrier protein
MLKSKIIFIGKSMMLSKCIDVVLKDFKQIFVITNDKNIKKRYRKKIYFISIDEIKKIQPDYLFSVLNDQILSKTYLNKVKKLALNFHDGPLPKYAGLFSSSWSIFNNEKNHGVCWHKIENKIDTGDILEEKKFKIKNDDTAYDIDTKGVLIGLKLFEKIFKNLKRNDLNFKKQNLKKRSYFGKKKLHGLIKKLKNNNNKNLIRSLIISTEKLKIIQDLFKISINVNRLKKKLNSKNNSEKLDEISVKKLLKFINDTIKTNFKYNKNNLSKIALNSHYKWDSLSHAKLLSTIEKKFKITINEKNIDQFSNLKLIYNYLNYIKVGF